MRVVRLDCFILLQESVAFAAEADVVAEPGAIAECVFADINDC